MSWVVFAIVASQLALIWYLFRKASTARDRAEAAEKTVKDLLQSVNSRDAAITKLEEGLQRERAAANMAARQRDDLLEKFAKHGDLHAVAAGIRSELSALSAMSKAPDVTADRSGVAGTVHGTAPGTPKRP